MCDAILGYTARLRAAWAIQLAWSNESRATKRIHKEDRKEGGSKGGKKREQKGRLCSRVTLVTLCPPVRLISGL